MFVKILLKICELFIRILSKLRVGIKKSATDILLEFRTPAQLEAEMLLHNSAANALSAEVSLMMIIPFRDKWELTSKCVSSILSQDLKHLKVTLVLIDNGSVEGATAAWIKKITSEALPSGYAIEYLRLDIPFNFSIINNKGFRAYSSRKPHWLLFLNNDIELIAPNTLEFWLGEAERLPNCGAVGCTLIYPDKSIQHLFLAPGIKLLAAHPAKGTPLDLQEPWYRAPRAVAAVTGAALLIKASEFEAQGGFNERLPEAGQDLDLCLELQRAGKTNWVVPNIVMVHHETATRSNKHKFTFLAFLYGKYGPELWNNRYFSKSLSRWSESPALSLGEGRYPWQLFFKDFLSTTQFKDLKRCEKIKATRKRISVGISGRALVNNTAESYFNKPISELSILELKSECDFKRESPMEGLRKLPYEDGSFAIVVCYGGNKPNQVEAELLNEITRVLRENGLLFCLALPYQGHARNLFLQRMGAFKKQHLYSWGRIAECLTYTDLRLLDHWQRGAYIEFIATKSCEVPRIG